MSARHYSPNIFFLIVATAVIILTFLQNTLANPQSPMPSLPPPTQQLPSQIPPAPTSSPPASFSTNQAQTNLRNAPAFPAISCEEKVHSYGIGAPPQGVSIMIAYTRLKNARQIKKLEELGLIINAVPIVKNTSKKKWELGISHLPENSLTIPPRFGAWLVYTTLANMDTVNEMNSKNTRKRVNFPVTVVQWSDNPSDTELLDFTCIVGKIKDVQPIPPPSPPSADEIPVLDEAAALRIKEKLSGVWFAKSVASAKSIEDRYVAFVQDKLCNEVFPNNGSIRCPSTYNAYILTKDGNIVFNYFGQNKHIWRYSLQGTTLKIKPGDAAEIIYRKTNIPITQQMIDEALTKAPTISNANISDITSTSATITWETDVPAKTGMNWGEVGARGSVGGNNEELVQNHRIDLDHLKPNTKYFFGPYSVNLGGLTKSQTIFFTTLP